jgi:hypothetical protein
LPTKTLSKSPPAKTTARQSMCILKVLRVKKYGTTPDTCDRAPALPPGTEFTIGKSSYDSQRHFCYASLNCFRYANGKEPHDPEGTLPFPFAGWFCNLNGRYSHQGELEASMRDPKRPAFRAFSAQCLPQLSHALRPRTPRVPLLLVTSGDWLLFCVECEYSIEYGDVQHSPSPRSNDRTVLTSP